LKVNRLHSLDAMRGILMLLGVYFHIAVFHYEDSALILFTTYSHFFRMPAFFLISGFFGALLYYQKGSREMILNRIKRILLPLIITLPFMHIFIVFSREFLGYQLENIGIVNSLIKALKTFNSPKAFFPLEYTHHLWFLNFLFTISFFIYLGDNIFKKTHFKGRLKDISLLLFNRPWVGILLFNFLYALLMTIMEKETTQGGDVLWASWFWFIFPSSIKSFIAFSFFYLAGWQLYHHRELLINLSAGRYFLIGIFMNAFMQFVIPQMLSIQYSPYWIFNESFSKAESSKQKVTFMLDMSDEIVVSGDGEYPAVYLNITPWSNPHGFEMDNIGGGIWSITKELSPGSYTYKFKNGFYDNWKEGWENWDEIGKGGCGYGKDNNRKLRVEDKNLTLGVFCWSECSDCFGNEISNAFYKENNFVKRSYIFIWNFGLPITIMFYMALFIKFFNKPSKRLRYISDSSYWIYIIHLPLTYFIPAFFHQSEMNVYLKFFVSSILVTAICFFTYHFFVRKTFIGQFLNGRKYD